MLDTYLHVCTKRSAAMLKVFYFSFHLFIYFSSLFASWPLLVLNWITLLICICVRSNVLMSTQLPVQAFGTTCLSACLPGPQKTKDSQPKKKIRDKEFALLLARAFHIICLCINNRTFSFRTCMHIPNFCSKWEPVERKRKARKGEEEREIRKKKSRLKLFSTLKFFPYK